MKTIDEAFEEWLDGKMSGGEETRREFIRDYLNVDLGDLRWAFTCGRNSMKKELTDNG